MAQNYKAGLIITGDASGGIRAIKATDDELSKLNKGFDRSSRDSRRFGSDAQRAGQQVRGMGDDASHASKGLTLVRQAATLAAAAFSIRQLTAYADGWSEINSRVLNATKDLDVSEHTMKRLAETARGTYSSLNQTAEAYLNNATTLTELGYSTERQLDLSDALNNSLVISATRGQQAESVMNALSKAFAAGELRGDNFNTVIQSGGRMAEALADGLGVTTIQLREMAAEGELTTSRVFEALTSQMEVLRKEAEDMPATIEDGWTLIGNASLELVGRVDKAFGTSEGIAGIMVKTADVMTESIEPLIDNMDTIQDVAVLTATVVAGRYAAAFATSAQQVAANTAQTVANTRANVAATTVARAKAAEVLRVAQAEQAAAARALANGHAIAAATGNTTLRSKAITQMAAANQRAIAAEAAHTSAVNANAAAMSRNTVAAHAMAGASRAAAGALALVGGPVGAAVLAGTAVYYFRDSLGITSAAARETKKDIDQLVDSLDNYTHAQYQSNRVSIVQDLAEARVEAEKLSRQILELQEQSQDQGMWYQGHSGSATHQLPELRAELREQQRIIRANEQGLREYDQAWKDVLQGQISGVSIFRTLDQWLMTNGDSASETSRRFNALGDSLGEGGEKWDDYIGKLQAARDVMGMTAAESAQYAAIQQGFTGLYADQAAAVAGQTDALSDYQKAVADGNEVEAQAHLARAQRYAEAEAMVQAQLQNIGTLTTLLQGVQTELSATALSAALVVGDGSGAAAANVAAAIEAINNRAAAIRNTTTVTVKNTAANREASKAAREAEQAAQKQADALQSIREEMDPLLREHATYVDRITVLEKALGAGTITQKDFGEAVRWSAEQYTRAASGAEDYENQTESLVGKYDTHNQRAKLLRTELDQINQRYRAGVIDGAQYGRMVQNIRDEMDQLANEADGNSDRIAQSFTTWGTVADNTLRSVDDAGRDAWLGLVDGSTSARETIERGFEQTLANIAHILTTQKLTFHVAGFMGMDTTGMPGGGGGGFNLGSMGSMRNGWQAVQSGVGNIQWTGAGGQQAYGGGWANAATQGTGASGYLGGSMQNFSGMQGLASAGTGFAGGYAGTQMGQSLFGKNAGSSWGATGGAVAGTYLGGPLGAALGGAIGGAIDAAFGRNKKTFDFDFEQGGHYGVFGDRESELGKFGITSFSDYKLGEQQDALQSLMDQVAVFDNTLANAAIDERVDAMRKSVEGFTHSGPENLFDARLREIINGSDALVEDAIAAIVDPEKMADAFVSVLNLERVMQSLNDQMRHDIETHLGANTQDVSGTVDSLGQAIDAAHLLGQSAESLNLQFDSGADGAIHYAWALQSAHGGVQNLAQLTDSYYQNFFTQAEREAELREQINEQMRALGFEMPKTRDGFRELVEAQNLNTTAGVNNVSALLQLESAFAQLTPVIEETGSTANNTADAIREQSQLEKQLLQAQGDTNALRRIEIERLAELETAEVDNLTAMQMRLYAIQDEEEAQKAAERAQQERTRGIERESQAWSRARDQLAGFTNNVNDWGARFDATNETTATPRERLDAADAGFWAQYEKALGGDRNAQQGITQFADRAIENLESYYASSAPGQAGIAEIRNAMERLPEMLSPEQFLADEFRLALGEQTGTLTNALDLNGDGTISALERSIAADWDTSQRLGNVLHHEMTRLGSTVLTEAQARAALGPHATDAEIARLIARVDHNGDGMITRQELMNVRIDALGGGIAGSLAPLFDQIDVDGSGWIDYGEFAKTFEGMATDAMLTDIFGIIDTNGDGQISYLEAIAASNHSLVELWASAQPAAAQSQIAEITGLYNDILNRSPDLSGLQYWTEQSQGGASLSEIEKYIKGSEEAKGSGRGLTARERGQRYLDRYPDVLRGWENDAEHWRKKSGANGPVQFAIWHAENIGVPEGRQFANGGVFTNSIVDQSTLFNMAEMGEAGPEAIVPLTRGAGGRLGIDATGLMKVPDGPMQLPMPNVPMPQFPALDNGDVVQVLQDVRLELKETRAENKRLLELIGDNTRDTADVVANYGERAEAQRDDQLDELETISRESKTRSTTV